MNGFLYKKHARTSGALMLGFSSSQMYSARSPRGCPLTPSAPSESLGANKTESNTARTYTLGASAPDKK